TTTDHMNVNILLLFQPAEESPGAAKDVVASGLLEHYHVEAIYGLHLMPMFDFGTLISKPGPMMAQCGEINITIHGKEAHAGTPEEGIDSIVLAAELIQNYQTIVSRKVSPFSPVVLNIGTIQGGQARNSVAGKVIMTGTLRCYDEKVFSDVVKQMAIVNQALELKGCQIDFDCEPMYPPLINDDNLFQLAQKVTDIDVLSTPLMLAEDFAFYGRIVPSLFVYIGTQKGQQTGLHTATFDFDESCLIKGVQFYIQMIKAYE
ncbi:MAG: amidohydrolase, partial [Erysipelotrichaceae bacterium]|nr:amidohydrolase [Erysipelotrichaceae bacterium]